MAKETTFKIPTGGRGKINSVSDPIDEGFDIGIEITEAKIGVDKKKRKDLRLEFKQIGEYGKVARAYVGFSIDKGSNSYINFLYYGGVLKKAGLDPNSQPTTQKLVSSLEKGAKVLVGCKYLAEIVHKTEKYQGKDVVKAEILSIVGFEETEPVITNSEPNAFDGFDETNVTKDTEVGDIVEVENKDDAGEVVAKDDDDDEFVEE